MIDIYLRHPEEAPSNAGQLLSKFLFKWTQISAWRQSGNPFSNIFISTPFVYVQACWNQMKMIILLSGNGVCNVKSEESGQVM